MPHPQASSRKMANPAKRGRAANPNVVRPLSGQSSGEGGLKSQPKLNVLIAEDNIANQLVAQTILRRAGHSVHLVSNGREAIETAQTQVFDLILMDIEMPDVNGIEATINIRAESGPNSKTLIIALTAFGSAAEKYAYQQAGIDYVLVKPFRIQDLNRVITYFFQSTPQSKTATLPLNLNLDTDSANISTPILDQKILTDILVAAQPDGLIAIIKSFWRSAYGFVDDMHTAREDAEVDSLSEPARALAGLAEGLGLTEIKDIASHIENTRPDLSGALLDELDGAFLRARKALNEVIRDLS